MKQALPQAADNAAGPTDNWAARRERGHHGLMRAMAWTAMLAGRRVSRCLLHPITLYFLLTAGEARRQSQRYLARALGRPATWTDSYRHIHCFAATVLDRIYFLRQRFDEFVVESVGQPVVRARLDGGEGAFLIGAHMGSFEALRALGVDDGRRVAMVMYEDNARLINATLAAISPQAEMRLIALGRLGAMLALRRWLDEGGIAGLLADRTLPGHTARSKTLHLPFLGQPARFSDGPFRLAAMLRRPVFFMIGLYHGGARYELRFVPLADFSTLGKGQEGHAAEMEAMILLTVQRYVALLESLCREAPYNWFNFFDFWADDASTPEAETRPEPTTADRPPAP